MAALPQQIQNAYARLSLAPGAGIEAVERAYAHALKQIDQASQAEAFGNLRAAYEMAMTWAHENKAGAWPGSAMDAAPVAPATPVAPAEPVASAEPAAPVTSAASVASPAPAIAAAAADVEAALSDWLGRLLDREQAHPHAILTAALQDERLASVAARKALETRIATVLAHDPWQRLEQFDAAVACFHWDTNDGGQLADRWTAAWIVQACSESLLWRGQAEHERLRQLDAINAALADPAPTEELLARHFFTMDELMSRFGYWLILRMPNHVLQAWSQAYNAPGFRRPPAPRVRAPRVAFRLSPYMIMFLVLVALAVLRLIFYPRGSPAHAWPAAKPSPAGYTQSHAAKDGPAPHAPE